MTSEEVVKYVQGWWNERTTIGKKQKYIAKVFALDNGNLGVDVFTPWHTVHQPIMVSAKNPWFKKPVYWCWMWNQYHYSGINDIKDLTKKKLYSMMLKQRRVLEHSPTL